MILTKITQREKYGFISMGYYVEGNLNTSRGVIPVSFNVSDQLGSQLWENSGSPVVDVSYMQGDKSFVLPANKDNRALGDDNSIGFIVSTLVAGCFLLLNILNMLKVYRKAKSEQ